MLHCSLTHAHVESIRLSGHSKTVVNVCEILEFMDFSEHADEVENVKNEDDSKLEFPKDDNMISRTENERLEAWKFFRLRNVKGVVSDKVTNPWTSPGVPCPTPKVEPERNKHNNHTKSGKHISFPLPGWMEDFQCKNRPATRAVKSVRDARLVIYIKFL